MDRTQVLKASTSLMDVLGISDDSKAYVQKQMAALLGVQDPNFYKEVERLWHEAYAKKIAYESCNKEVFATEAIVNGLKYVKDERLKTETEKLASLRVKFAAAEKAHKEAIARAQEAQNEYLKNRIKT